MKRPESIQRSKRMGRVATTRATAAAGAVALVLSACGSSSTNATPTEIAETPITTAAPATTGGETSPTSDSDGAGTATATEASMETRDEILRLARTTLDGATLDPDVYAGEDVLLWFWAPW